MTAEPATATAETETAPRLMLPYTDSSSSSDLTTRQVVKLTDHRPHPICVRDSMEGFDPTADYHGLNLPSSLLVARSGVGSSPFLFDLTDGSKTSLPPLPPPSPWNQCVGNHSNIRNFNPKPIDSSLLDELLGPGFYSPSIHQAVVSLGTRKFEEVMVLYEWNSQLLFHRRGDDRWTPLDVDDDHLPVACPRRLEWQPWMAGGFRCATYCNGRFYAVDYRDYLFVCDTSSPPYRATGLVRLPFLRLEPQITSLFLLASCLDHDELLLVIKRVNDPRRNVHDYQEFQVFKFVVVGGQPQWSEMRDIGSQAIFVCRENAFAIAAKDIITPNCIYFTELLGKDPIAETVTEVSEYCIFQGKRKSCAKTDPSRPVTLGRPFWFRPT